MKEKRDYRRYYNPGLLLLQQRPILWVCSGLQPRDKPEVRRAKFQELTIQNFLEVI